MRRRITIRNETRWRTGDLRRFLHRAAAMVFRPDEKPIIRCRVSYSRRHHVGGCASVGGTAMDLHIGTRITDLRIVAAVIVHEMGHLKGLEHRDMLGSSFYTDRGLPPGEVSAHDRWIGRHEWGRELPLRWRVEKQKVRLAGVALIEAKREKVIQALARWRPKAKRAATAIRKLSARLKRYDRQMAAKSSGEVKPS